MQFKNTLFDVRQHKTTISQEISICFLFPIFIDCSRHIRVRAKKKLNKFDFIFALKTNGKCRIDKKKTERID